MADTATATDTTAPAPAPAPKKRSLFKRAAWQDAAKKENEDIFSHSNEFKDIVAEQDRRRDEERRRKEEEVRQRKCTGPQEGKSKRRRVSTGETKSVPLNSGLSASPRASGTPHSPVPVQLVSSGPAPESLAVRYNDLTNSLANGSLHRKEPVIINLSDDDDGEGSAPYAHYTKFNGESTQDMAVRASELPAVDDEDDIEEVLDPTLAALQAKARQKALQRTHSAGALAPETELEKVPIAQLFIDPMIPGANPLMVKVRIDSTMEKPRKAWCERQTFQSGVAQSVFFTWKGTRLYDSTTIKRLGIQVDKHGNVSMDGDPSIYDDVNVPKIHVEAWTEELFQQQKKLDAAAAAAKRLAAEAPLKDEQRDSMPESEPVVTKVRLVLKVKGRDEFRLSVNPVCKLPHVSVQPTQRLMIIQCLISISAASSYFIY